ncbi:hypothetical protein ACQCWA_20825 [Rossellomorea aquimaris]|uniref:hypothetical protein n=1 Tax=Rossellomorea aquimaris TaxID=189382 RepID=UPI003CEF3749
MNKIWHASNLNSADWFINGSSLNMNWQPMVIPNAGSADFLNLPESIKKILRLDKPDLIATVDLGGVDVPVVSIELTTTTPQSQHAKQRVPRLVAAAEANVPSIYIIPGRKLSGGSSYRLGADLYYGVDKIQQINGIPVFIYTYPDNGGNLIHDRNYPNQPDLTSQSMIAAFRTIDELILNRINRLGIQGLYNNPWVVQELQNQANIGSQANVLVSNYNTLTEIPTTDLQQFLMQNTNMTSSRINNTISKLPSRITNRHQTIIFRPGGRLLQHANDPYSGMMAFFDYCFCRIDRGVEDREKNLLYMPMNDQINNITDEFSPAGYHRYWQNSCPFRLSGVPTVDQQFQISHHLQYGCEFSKSKPLRILGYFSDMLIFQDSVLVF